MLLQEYSTAAGVKQDVRPSLSLSLSTRCDLALFYDFFEEAVSVRRAYPSLSRTSYRRGLVEGQAYTPPGEDASVSRNSVPVPPFFRSRSRGRLGQRLRALVASDIHGFPLYSCFMLLKLKLFRMSSFDQRCSSSNQQAFVRQLGAQAAQHFLYTCVFFGWCEVARVCLGVSAHFFFFLNAPIFSCLCRWRRWSHPDECMCSLFTANKQ